LRKLAGNASHIILHAITGRDYSNASSRLAGAVQALRGRRSRNDRRKNKLDFPAGHWPGCAVLIPLSVKDTCPNELAIARHLILDPAS
jgi:hypothetical protein